MTGLKYSDIPAASLRPGAQRRIAHTDHLMMVIIDFDDGPKARPDPPHSHPHEQVTYVAEGEINFFLEDQPFHLAPGDVFTVPPGLPHTIQQLTPHVRLIDCFTPLREDFLK
jgi:quercetin dioxygenase-like cupin family protein